MITETSPSFSSVSLPQAQSRSVLGSTLGMVGTFLADLLVLSGAFVIAIYLRQTIPLGTALPASYPWTSPQPFVGCALGLVAANLLRVVPARTRSSRAIRRFWTPLVGAGLAGEYLLVFGPPLSTLQLGYFAAAALVMTVLVVPWPGAARDTITIKASLRRLWVNRSLVRIWVQFNIQSRYAQAVLGILWIVLIPLSTALVMTVVFSQLLRIPVGNVPFISFFLAALVPWGLFNQSIGAGMRSIIGAMGLITQIYFPREIVVLSALGEALVDTCFMFVAMLLVDTAVGIYPNDHFAVLPVVLLIELVLTAGLMLQVSWLSVLVRDVPQLVSVLLQMLFYLCPILYPLSIIPARYRFFIALNPLTALIESFRTVIVYNRAPQWPGILYAGAIAFGMLVFGYRCFKAHEDTLADMI